jgi:hypothetical protein
VAARHRARRRSSPVPSVLAVFFVLLSAAAVASALVLASFQDTGKQADPADETGLGDPMTVRGKVYDTVPDGCDMVSAALAAKLAPGADRAGTSNADGSGRDSSCTWAKFGASGSRQLTVELRAVAAERGADAAAAADRVLRGEWRADRAGRKAAAARGLPGSSGTPDSPSARGTRYRNALTGVGDVAYVIYNDARADGVGAAIVNVRVSNMLITVNYSGTLLPERVAVTGGVAVAKSVATRLGGTRPGDSPS